MESGRRGNKRKDRVRQSDGESTKQEEERRGEGRQVEKMRSEKNVVEHCLWMMSAADTVSNVGLS